MELLLNAYIYDRIPEEDIHVHELHTLLSPARLKNCILLDRCSSWWCTVQWKSAWFSICLLILHCTGYNRFLELFACNCIAMHSLDILLVVVWCNVLNINMGLRCAIAVPHYFSWFDAIEENIPTGRCLLRLRRH